MKASSGASASVGTDLSIKELDVQIAEIGGWLAKVKTLLADPDNQRFQLDEGFVIV